MTEKHENLAAALAAFQADLPAVHKGASGQVQGRKDYRYADLADINGVVLPLLGRHGLSFSAKPTLNAAGRFVLAYTLRHSSGELDAGEYPLPEDVTPQQMGSAQTYARRYAIQAMTGVAPDEDDDGQAANTAHENRRPAQTRDEPAGRSVASARAELAAACEANGWDRDIVAGKYAEKAGHALGAGTDPALIESFRAHLFNLPQSDLIPVPAVNGAAQ